jgi:hypothetical protein
LVIAVAGGCAGEPCQITLAAGIYKGMTADFVQSLMILIADLLDFSVLAIGASDEGVQEHVHPGLAADVVEHPFDSLRLEGNEDSSMALWRSHGVKAAQTR